ncbi:MAG: TIGR02757 family protein [Chitinophagaceae bacterium]
MHQRINTTIVKMKEALLKKLLDSKVELYCNPLFIEKDPILIPHLFKRKEDIEISGFFAAIFSWGNRTTIIHKSKELMERMDMNPYEFCMHASKKELIQLESFVHRTFKAEDLYYFIEFFKHHYTANPSLESAFTQFMNKGDENTEQALKGFRNYFFSLEHLKRTKKHISTPDSNSTCKRLNMYLRWMVRKGPVDFGIWNSIKSSQLVCPLDVHVFRVAKKLKMMNRKSPDWIAAVELTKYLKKFDPKDPIKYDFALFSLGVLEKY